MKKVRSGFFLFYMRKEHGNYSEQMDQGRGSCSFTAFQHRNSVLLVNFQPGNRKLHWLFKGSCRVGIQLCDFLFRNVGCFPWKSC